MATGTSTSVEMAALPSVRTVQVTAPHDVVFVTSSGAAADGALRVASVGVGPTLSITPPSVAIPSSSPPYFTSLALHGVRTLSAAAACIDDLALTERWQGRMWAIEATGFGGMCLLFQLLALKGRMTAGAAFFALPLHRALFLMVDVLLILGSCGPWDTRQGLAPIHSGQWLPRLLRLADGMGWTLTVLMATFLVAGGGINIALPAPGSGMPGRPRAAMSIYKTVLFPVFLSTAVQSLIVASTAFGYLVLRMDNLIEVPIGPVTSRRPMSRPAIAMSVLGPRALALLLNASTMPLAMKLDDYSTLSWDAVLFIPWVLSVFALICAAVLAVAIVTDAIVSKGGCGGVMRRGAVTTTPWTDSKATLAAMLVTGCSICAAGLAVTVNTARSALVDADAVFQADTDANAVMAMTDDWGNALITAWMLTTVSGVLTVWLVCSKALSLWRVEFARAHGVQTPGSHAIAAHALYTMTAEAEGSSRAEEGGTPRTRPFVPPPTCLVRIGFTRYRRLQPASDDVRKLAAGEPPADAEEELKQWLSAEVNKAKLQRVYVPPPPSVRSAPSRVPSPQDGAEEDHETGEGGGAEELQPLSPSTVRYPGTSSSSPSWPAWLSPRAGQRAQRLARKGQGQPHSRGMAQAELGSGVGGIAAGHSRGASCGSHPAGCAICFESECDAVLIECGHALCTICAEKVLGQHRASGRRCPFCRAEIDYCARLCMDTPPLVALSLAAESFPQQCTAMPAHLSCMRLVERCTQPAGVGRQENSLMGTSWREFSVQDVQRGVRAHAHVNSHAAVSDTVVISMRQGRETRRVQAAGTVTRPVPGVSTSMPVGTVEDMPIVHRSMAPSRGRDRRMSAPMPRGRGGTRRGSNSAGTGQARPDTIAHAAQ